MSDCRNMQLILVLYMVRAITIQIPPASDYFPYNKIIEATSRLTIVSHEAVCLIKCFLPSKSFLAHVVVLSLFHFHRTLFCGLAEACVNSGCFSSKLILFIHSLVCQLTHSFLNGFQPNLYQHFSHVCSTYTSQVDSSHNLDPFI